MPVLQIEYVLQPGENKSASLAKDLAEAAAAVFERPTGATWVRLRQLSNENYAEDGGVPPGVAPVFADVLLRSLPPLKDRQRLARELAQAVAQACNRPIENVHITLQPAGSGRVAFGGELIR